MQKTLLILLCSGLTTGYAQTLKFTDMTDRIDGLAQLDETTESAAWGDYDNDGDEDLYLTNAGANKMFRNDGNGSFVEVAQQLGVAHAGVSVGVAFGDFDNDGDLDLYVVTFRVGDDLLYRNDGWNPQSKRYVFSEMAAPAGLSDDTSSRGLALLDYDRDGLLDVYVNALGNDILYHNDGNLTFSNQAASAGVVVPGQGVGVTVGDFDKNGWPDLFTANRSDDPNRLLLNYDGHFTDITETAGITVSGQGMGVIGLDFDNDLDLDLYYTSWPGEGEPAQSNALYENQGKGIAFIDIAARTGTLDTRGWGISANTGDIDLDGYEDFFVTNGFDKTSTPNVLFRNENGRNFADVTEVIGGGAFDGRGVAFADYDNDGDLDLCVTGGPGAATRLWRNDSERGANRWLTLHLTGTRSNRSAIGAQVTVQTDIGRFYKEVSGGAGRGSQNSLPLEFGLGPAVKINEITIRWPGGQLQSMNNVRFDQFLDVTEPDENR